MTSRSSGGGATAVVIIGAIVLGTLTSACSSAASRSPVTQPAASLSARSASGGTSGTSPVPSRGFYFRGTITITGAATVTTTFVQLNAAVGGGDVSAERDQQTCAKAAAVGDANFGIGASGDTWQVPNKISDISAPATVNVTVASSRWKGPGTYGTDALLGTSGVRINDATYYDVRSASAATLTVNPDGSGSLTFQDAPVSGQSAPIISGSVNWTCINHAG